MNSPFAKIATVAFKDQVQDRVQDTNQRTPGQVTGQQGTSYCLSLLSAASLRS